jgi:hypothetical protein
MPIKKDLILNLKSLVFEKLTNNKYLVGELVLEFFKNIIGYRTVVSRNNSIFK